jgi:4,5-DOPA dioxygenase extradiol
MNEGGEVVGMPAVFFGHGNPMNALARNEWTAAWAAVGANIPRPRAILCVSAHWYVPGVFVTAAAAPRTIHDFGGFPRELYEVLYPAAGEPELAERVRELLDPIPVGLDMAWGLDHGTWSVLCHVYPEADVPVIQLSIDETLAPLVHYEMAKGLSPLRDEGVLIMGSGNVVHNLHTYAWGRHPVEPLAWAERFELQARELMLAGDHMPLVNYEMMGRDAMLSAPTPEHYLPLLYVLAQQREGEEVSFPVEGFDGGSISMLGVRVG